MKRNIITLLTGVLLIAFLAWISLKLMSNKGKSDSELIEFAISDTTNISQIIITDAQSNKITLVNKNGLWTEDNGDCVSQQNVSFILDAAKNIEFKGYLPKKFKKIACKAFKGLTKQLIKTKMIYAEIKKMYLKS